MCFSPQRRAIFRHQNFKKFSEDYSFSTFSLPNALFATAACHFSTSEVEKVFRCQHFFDIFTSKCAFRHRGVHFSNIRTYKSGPNTSCFLYILTSECAFRHSGVAIFRHLNFKKWSETVSLLAFSLQKVLFATAACNF